jgi:triosephosphate isomerase
MSNPYILIANWKMNVSLKEALEFGRLHIDELHSSLSKKNYPDLVICPSFISLYPYSALFEKSSIKLGAQDCSPIIKGNYTGQVSVKSLHEAGCTFCIIGHSERRKYNHEADEEITKKCIHLIDYGISPIICIGETQEEHTKKETCDVLKRQLENITSLLKDTLIVPKKLPLLIAYEPVWAIGTGKIPTKDHLEMVFSWLSTTLRNQFPEINWKFLYGGSVNEKTVYTVKSVSNLDGFLVGGASTQFEQLKKLLQALSNERTKT